jgi:transcription elongation factor Elf1
MSDTIETHRQDFITCPHCGYAERDSWEVDFGPGLEGDTEVQCGKCEKIFEVSRQIDVYYTSKVKP